MEAELPGAIDAAAAQLLIDEISWLTPRLQSSCWRAGEAPLRSAVRSRRPHHARLISRRPGT